jgi:hypothetical protein
LVGGASLCTSSHNGPLKECPLSTYNQPTWTPTSTLLF